MAARPRLILHIGAGKTGSTALQEFLGTRASRLAQSGYLVPGNDLSIKPGDGLQTMYFQRLVPLDDRKIATVTDRFNNLRRRALKTGASTIIVSAENLLDSGDNHAHFEQLFVPLQDLFNVIVVVYIRRQDEFLQAAWAHWYMKTTPSFRTWLETVVGRLAVWNDAITSWETALPEASIVVRTFDKSRLVDSDIVSDFINVVGLDADELGYQPGLLINRSLSEAAIRVAHRNRHLFSGVHDHSFTNLIGQLGGAPAYEPVNSGLYLTADERRTLLAVYAESNELLRKRHLPDLPAEGLFPPVGRDSRVLDREEVIEQELDLLWNVIYEMNRRQPKSMARALIRFTSKARRMTRGQT